MSYDREKFIANVEQELGFKLNVHQRKRVDVLASETADSGHVAAIIRADSTNGRGIIRELVPLVLIGGVIAFGVWATKYYYKNYSDNAKVLFAAEKTNDPMIARSIIQQAVNECADNSLSPFNCWSDDWRKADEKYFAAATAAGDPKALRELFTSGVGYLPLKTTMKGKTLELAKTSNSPDILVAAAEIYRDDRLDIIDTEKEKDYRYRAWVAGDKSSAGRLAEIYVDQGEIGKAYLWSLRCVQECERSVKINLDKLSEKLPSEAVTRIQERAKENR